MMNGSTTKATIGRVASELTQLSEEDLPLVVEFVEFLKQRKAKTMRPLSPAKIRAQARRRAALLQNVPREEIVARFRELTEEIREEAISQGTAIEGDWVSD
jgi:hypothetical protein